MSVLAVGIIAVPVLILLLTFLARRAIDRAYARGFYDGFDKGLSGTPEAARRRAEERSPLYPTRPA